MDYVSLDFREGINRWFEWENRLSVMSEFPMHDRYKASKSNNEYDRFVGFVKEWAFERMKTAEKIPNPNNVGEIIGFNFSAENNVLVTNKDEEAFAMLSFKRIDNQRVLRTLDERVDDPDKFWKAAMASSGNKKIKESMPKIDGEYNKPVYALFMPAYRALKDRFEQRSIWQWFTNHDQYTAERDSIKALEGIMRSLTGDSLEKVTKQLNITRERFPEKDRKKCEEAEIKRLEAAEADRLVEKNKKSPKKDNIGAMVSNELKEKQVPTSSEKIIDNVSKYKYIEK